MATTTRVCAGGFANPKELRGESVTIVPFCLLIKRLHFKHFYRDGSLDIKAANRNLFFGKKEYYAV
jgi:hypothetical protein